MKRATKAADNAYYKARMKAVSFNDGLSSREGAADEIGIDRTKLARIELDIITPYPEDVKMMADTYNAPELMNYHCTSCCPIGKETITKVDSKSIEQIALSSYTALQNANTVKDIIMDVAKDGIIDEDEKPMVEAAMKKLDEIAKVAAELKLYVKKLQ